jgi:hypothetical protein
MINFLFKRFNLEARPARPKSAESGPGRFGWLFNITIFKSTFNGQE